MVHNLVVYWFLQIWSHNKLQGAVIKDILVAFSIMCQQNTMSFDWIVKFSSMKAASWSEEGGSTLNANKSYTKSYIWPGLDDTARVVPYCFV